MTSTTTHAPAPGPFSAACRQWRQQRKLSQLELALAADVSQRHVSWLETGRSQPSRDMVLRLGAALNLSLRDQNTLLHAAGFAPMYRESALNEPFMAPVLDALVSVLAYHNPRPAFVIDRMWNVVMTNDAADRLFGLVGNLEAMSEQLSGDATVNLALLTVHPDGLRPLIANWEDAAPVFAQRLRQEAMAASDMQVRLKFESILELIDPVPPNTAFEQPLLPVMPLTLRLGDMSLSLFSTMSTFGTPQDITTDELRIEAFYPADAESAAFFDQLAAAAPDEH